jgi:hypothetical protein
MSTLRRILTRVDHRAESCRPLSAAERMVIHSQRRAQEIQDRENEGAAAPRVRIIQGRPVLIALSGSVNQLPKDKP